MRRRTVLSGIGVGLVAGPVAAHTPYRQWKIYRLRHLLIGTSRADEPTYPLGRDVVAVLAEHLPRSSPRVTRARTVTRLGDLIRTGQIRLLLLSRDHAQALATGREPFAPAAPVPLRALFVFGDHVLVSDAGFPDHHAYHVTRTLARHGTHLAGAAPPDDELAHLPTHPGTLAAARGQPEPEPPPPSSVPEGADPEHAHTH